MEKIKKKTIVVYEFCYIPLISHECDIFDFTVLILIGICENTSIVVFSFRRFEICLATNITVVLVFRQLARRFGGFLYGYPQLSSILMGVSVKNHPILGYHLWKPPDLHRAP